MKSRAPLRYVALLRGINIGKAKRVAMADLRSLVEDLGFLEVRTLLNSGNVVFTVPGKPTTDLAGRLKKALIERTGVSATVVVLADPADRAKVKSLAKQDWGNELLVVGDRVAYIWCADGILAGKLFTAVDRLLGDRVTARNWATMTKLDALVRQEK